METTKQEGVATIWKDAAPGCGPNGTLTKLITYLPEASANVPVTSLETLQGRYNGALHIERGAQNRVLIERSFQAFSKEDTDKEIARLRDHLQRDLGFESRVE